MDLFTQNMINRTKQRQEQLSKSKPGLGLAQSSKQDETQSPSVKSKQGQLSKPNASLVLANSSKQSDEQLSPSFKMRQQLSKPKMSLAPTQFNKQCEEQQSPSITLSKKQKAVEVPNEVSVSTSSKTNKENCVDFSSSRKMTEVAPFNHTSPLPNMMKDRLGALASCINDWEDESGYRINHVTSTPEKNSNMKCHLSAKKDAISQRLVESESSPKKSQGIKDLKGIKTPTSNVKPITLDKSVLQSLESQGFTPTESRSRLIYEFEKEQEDEIQEETAKSWTFASVCSPRSTASPVSKPSKIATFVETPSKVGVPRKQIAVDEKRNASLATSTPGSKLDEKSKPSNQRLFSVQQLAAQFDSPKAPAKDPIEMTLNEKRAIFESNKKSNSSLFSKASSKSNRSSQNLRGMSPSDPIRAKKSSGYLEPTNLNKDPSAEPCHFETKDSPQVSNENRYDNLISRIKEQNAHPSESNADRHLIKHSAYDKNAVHSSPLNYRSPEKSITEEKSEQQPEEPPTDPYAGVHRVRPIRVSPPKPGRLYPCLMDIEAIRENEDEPPETNSSVHQEENDDNKDITDLDSSFAIDILGKAGLSHFINTPQRKLNRMELTTQSDDFMEDSASASISNLLDEALNETGKSLSPKRQREEDEEGSRAEQEDGTLFHSITSYRQLKEKSFTPVKQVVRNPDVTAVSDNDVTLSNKRDEDSSVQQKIRCLQAEISTQQNVMAQASQALNLCRSTAEFSGSTEQVEGEKLLLISSQKRNAAICEIQRLKSEGALNKSNEKSLSRGTISFSRIGLPLKKEFLAMLHKGGVDIVHYFIVLIRNRGQIIPLQMLSTIDGIQDGVLRFPNLIQLSNLPADFEISIEVFALQTRKEKFNHELKYHIKKENSKLRLTPKKLISKQDSRGASKTPVKASSTANLRSSSFGLIGVCSVTPKTLRNCSWTLENVPTTSPINGTLELKIQSRTETLVEERGFLTVFEDVGGFGAWHRRWCLLTNDQMLFWKYPDEEKRMEPQYVINLKKCITENVDIVSNDVCARPNTFMLVTVRPPESNDKNSLVMTRHSSGTAVRHLISADLKAERQLWCNQINKVLDNLRVWDIELN